ncbi:MAG: 2-hydroxyacyl-CoA dehydratase [Chlorobiaceae bacterium]|nr:2-hydroxyacyl-CoA dehydratase [Chlorobiaceae bacterium]
MSLTTTDKRLVEPVKSFASGSDIRNLHKLHGQLTYIEQSKKEHAYSPAVVKLYDLALSYVADAETHARNGGRVARVMGPWMAPLMYAMDIVPIPLNELDRSGSDDTITIAEDHFQLPKETCSMVSSMLGDLYLHRDRPIKDLVVFNGRCEPLNIASDLVAAEGYRVHRIEAVNRPLDNDPERLAVTVRFLADELADLAIRLTGKPVDLARVEFEIARSNRILGKVRRIFDLRKSNPLYIKTLGTMFMVTGSANFFGKPEQYEATLDLLIEELITADYIRSARGKIVQLAWVGGRSPAFGLYKTIDDCGGAVTAWATPNSWSQDWPRARNPLESIALQILGKTGGNGLGSPVHRLKPIERLVNEFGASGIIFYSFLGCFRGVHQEIQRDHFQKLAIPSIGLEGTFHVGPPSGQLLTRIRAFIEMLS